MNIAYVSGVKLVLDMVSDKVVLSSEPLNFGWEVREFQALAKRGHTVHWVSPYCPLIADSVDVVFCAADRMSSEAIRLGSNFNAPVVLQMISMPATYQDEIWDEIKEAMKQSQGITCVSEVVLRGVEKWAEENDYHGLIKRVPHGVDTALANSVSDGERNSFLYIGALMGHKSIDVLIRAAAKTGLPLRILGDGPERGKLESLAMIYNAPVIFLGALDELQKFGELKRAKALLHASIGEQFWIPGCEALACNTRVICNKLRDVWDTYKDSLIYFADFDQLCTLMQDFWKLPAPFPGEKSVWIENLGLSLDARSKKLTKTLEEVIS